MLFALFVLLLVAFITKKYFGSYYKGYRLPPGPMRLPFIGSIPELIMWDPRYPHLGFDGIAQKYGDIASLGLGVHYTVLLSGYEVMKDLLKRPELTDRYRFQFSWQRTFGENLGLIFACGDTWAKVRKYTVKQLRELGYGKPGMLEKAVSDEVDWAISYIRKESEKSGEIWKPNIATLAIPPMNVLWRSLGGNRFDPDNSSIWHHLHLIEESSKVMRPVNLLVPFPFLAKFPHLSGYNRNGVVFENVHNYIRYLINEAKLKKEARHDESEKETNFIEAFLEEIEKNRENPESLMTENQLIAVLMDLFFAGTETVATCINWVILYLTLHPDVQQRARKDILEFSNDAKTKISYKNSRSLPFVMACIWETLRFSPFGSTAPPRTASEDIIYGDYIIPKGSCIFYNFYSIFHDKKYWGDPEVFRPDRLLDETGTGLDPEKIQRIPQFGFGKRVCFGDGVALEIIFVLIVALLSNFKFDVISGREPTYETGAPAIVITPKPYEVMLTPL